MALLYQAQLTPTKIDLLTAWVPGQPWLGGADASTLEVVGAYRFDDPEGEVGIETHLLRAASGQVIQVPLTYRNAPLDEAQPALITTLNHSVLGTRWVYDGCADSVYASALATTILTRGTEAELDVVTGDSTERRQSTTRVLGSGTANPVVPTAGALTFSSEGTRTAIRLGELELVVLRVIDPGEALGSHDGAPTLTGTWPGQESPVLLAVAN